MNVYVMILVDKTKLSDYLKTSKGSSSFQV